MKDCVIFVNTNAGKLKITPGSNTIEQRAQEVGLDAEIVLCKSSEDLNRSISLYLKKGAKKIVVSGGDGTVHLAAQHLVHTDCILGIIPMGTANNFANALHIPLELSAALSTIKDGTVKKVSVGKVGKHYFVEGAGVGLFADALSLYGAGTNKNIFKGVLTLFKLIFSLPRSRITITLDGKKIVERAAMCTIANIARIAQSYPIAPDAHLTDEVLDVVVIGNINRRELLTYYRAVRAQIHSNLPKATIYQARTITIESSRGLNVHCDDKIIGTTPITFTIEPHALQVITSKI